MTSFIVKNRFLVLTTIFSLWFSCAPLSSQPDSRITAENKSSRHSYPQRERQRNGNNDHEVSLRGKSDEAPAKNKVNRRAVGGTPGGVPAGLPSDPAKMNGKENSGHKVERQLEPSAENNPQVDKKSSRMDPEREPVVEPLSYYQIVRKSRRVRGSFSKGRTNRGTLKRAARLPIRGQYHAILPMARNRGTNYGTIELVRLVIHAAKETARRYPSTITGVGNLSKIKGRRLPWSRSHRSGRDADIAFYVKSHGVRVSSPGFVRFADETMVSHTGKYSFDIERNWAFVEFLLTQERAPVQWIFIANHLKGALLSHAKKTNADPNLLKKAEKILHQPRRGSPHDDHFHIRIYCSKSDLLEGCHNVPPFWDGIQPYDEFFEARIMKLLSGLHDKNPRLRVAVIKFLTRIDGIRAAPTIAERGLWDPSKKVRIAAVDALIHWRSDHPVVLRSLVDLIVRRGRGFFIDDPSLDRGRLLRTLAPAKHLNPVRHGLVVTPSKDRVRTPHLIRRAYVALEKISSSKMTDFLLAMLRSKRIVASSKRYGKSLPEVVLAAWSARNILDERLVEPLIDVLEHPDRRARSAASLALRRIAVHSFRYDWSRPMGRYKRFLAAARWRKWWEHNKSVSRHQRLTDLLEIVRPALKKYKTLEHPMAIRNLIAVTDYDSYLGYNAHRLLIKITKRRWARYDWTPTERSFRWYDWWRSTYPEKAAILKSQGFDKGVWDSSKANRVNRKK